MKVLLSLCAILFTVGCECGSLDRIRNKVCYKAKVCIHTAKEKCGVDSKGKLRLFFDSCDILEYNCLKGTDYVKTSITKCDHLPPISEQTAPGTESHNNNQEGGEVNDVETFDKPEIKGSITLHTDGSIEGEVIIPDGFAGDEPQQQGKRPTNKGNYKPRNNKQKSGEVTDEGTLDQHALTGNINVHTDGSIEGEVIIPDGLAGDEAHQQSEGPTNKDNYKPYNNNQKSREVTDEGTLDQHALTGNINVHTDGSVEGEVIIPDGLVEDDTQQQGEEPTNKDNFKSYNNNQKSGEVSDEGALDQHALTGNINVHTDGSVEGEVVIPDGLAGDETQQQGEELTNKHNFKSYNNNKKSGEVSDKGVLDQHALTGNINVHTDGSVEGEVIIPDGLVGDETQQQGEELTNKHNFKSYNNNKKSGQVSDEGVLDQHALTGNINVHTDGSVEGEVIIPDGLVGDETQQQGEETANKNNFSSYNSIQKARAVSDKETLDQHELTGSINIHTDGSVEGEVVIPDGLLGDETQGEEPTNNSKSHNNNQEADEGKSDQQALKGNVVTLHADGSIEGDFNIPDELLGVETQQQGE